MGMHSVRRMAILVVSGLVLSANVVRGDLVTYWGFDDTEPGIAADAIGDNQGVVEGAVVHAPGYKGTAFRFDGSTGYVSVGSAPAFDIVGAITISAWIKVEAFERPYQTILAKGDSAWRMARDLYQDKLQFAANNGQRRWVVRGNISVNDGKWHHVVGLFDGSRACLYVDGQLDASLATRVPIQTNDYDVFIGENAERPGRYWNGLIDEVLIFDHALSEEEIRQLHGVGARVFMPEALRALRETAERAEASLRADKTQQAITLIERGIARYRQLKHQSLRGSSESDGRLLSDLYFLLANAKDLTGASENEVTPLYVMSILPTWRSKNVVPALQWLDKNVSAEVCQQVIRRSMANRDDITNDLGAIARGFRARQDWPAFEVFLRTVFAEGGYGTPAARAILEDLGADSTWGRAFLDFSRQQPALWPFFVEVCDNQIQRHVRRGDFLRAGDVYRDVARYCVTPEDRTRYEFLACECIFRSGRYDDAIPAIDHFVDKNGTTNPILARKATLLKGRAHMHLKQMGQAVEAFRTLATRYPEAEEANLYIAYCKLAQGELQEAEKRFSAVVRDQPQTSSACRARLCLQRIEKMRQ